MGDSFQLEPVGKDPGLFKGKVSKVDKKIELTEVKRQQLTSSILELATAIRTSKEPLIFNKSSKDVHIDTPEQFNKSFLDAIKSNEDAIAIVATNSTRISLNRNARKVKFTDPSITVNEGEIIISNAKDRKSVV